MRISDWSSDVCSSDLVYFSLTALAAVAYGFAGMGGFDAVNHAMTTVSTAGFSTRDTSLAGFSPAVHWVSIVFMLAGAVPFLLYVRLLRGTSGFVPWSQIRSEEHTSELQSLMRISYAVFCLKKKNNSMKHLCTEPNR